MRNPRRYYASQGSTRWIAKPGRLAPDASPACELALVPPSGARVKYRDARKPLQAMISLLGGSEAKWLIVTRGEEFVVPGHASFHDVMNFVNGIVQTYEMRRDF